MKNTRIIFAIELEKRITGAGIIGIIIDKFSDLYNTCLVILHKVDKSLEKYFYCTM